VYGHTHTAALDDDTRTWLGQFHQSRRPSQKSFCGSTITFWSYNIAMPASAPRRQPDLRSSDDSSFEHHRPPQIYTLEATGLLVIAGLLLILGVARYWHHIAWGVR
jgi:hypothetical protein